MCVCKSMSVCIRVCVSNNHTHVFCIKGQIGTVKVMEYTFEYKLNSCFDTVSMISASQSLAKPHQNKLPFPQTATKDGMRSDKNNSTSKIPHLSPPIPACFLHFLSVQCNHRRAVKYLAAPPSQVSNKLQGACVLFLFFPRYQ